MTPADSDDFDAMTTLLEYIVDSFEKLEILVHLYRARPMPITARSIGRTLQLGQDIVMDVLATLKRAGIVRAHFHNDEAGWSFDPGGVWATSVDVLVDLYDIDRAELLAFIKHIALQGFGSEDRRSSTIAFAGRRKHKPQSPN